MTGTATPRRAESQRRVEVRLTTREYDALDDAARANARSMAGQARTLIVCGRGLASNKRRIGRA